MIQRLKWARRLCVRITLMPEQLTDGIVHRAAGANVFGACQLLLEKAVHFGFGLAACFLVRNS